MDQRMRQLTAAVQSAVGIAKSAHSAYQTVQPLLQKLKGKKSNGRKTRKSNRGASRDKTISLPSTNGAISTSFSHMNFGQAASHTDFEGAGLRIHGVLPPRDFDSMGNGATAGDTSFFGGVAGIQGCNWAVSPTAYLIGASRAWVPTPIFGVNGPMASFAQFFRKFRFRKLYMIWEGNQPNSTAGSVQISYDTDANAVNSNVFATSNQSRANSQIIARFPVWTPQLRIKLIDDMKTTRADELHELTSVDTSITLDLASNADIVMYTQGAVMAVSDIVSTGTATVYGRFRWEFVIDLYGFSTQSADNTITLQNAFGRISRQPKPSSDKKDKDERKERRRRSLSPDTELVDLTPRQSRSSSTKGSINKAALAAGSAHSER